MYQQSTHNNDALFALFCTSTAKTTLKERQIIFKKTDRDGQFQWDLKTHTLGLLDRHCAPSELPSVQIQTEVVVALEISFLLFVSVMRTKMEEQELAC